MTTAAVPAPIATSLARDLLVLLKVRIGSLVVLTSLAAAVAAGERDPVALLVLGATAFAAAAGASALNHYLDRDLDARMARTRGRPLPAGRIANARVAAWLGLALIAASQAALPVLGAAVVLYLLAGALTYALVYTAWLKRRTPYSIVVGGAAGSFAALAGWETGATTWAVEPQLVAALLFLWTPSHFWSLAIVLERDYREARLPMLSAVAGAERTAGAVLANTVALVAVSLALAAFLPWTYGLAAAPAGVGFLACTVWLRRRPDRARAFTVFKLSGVYLLVLLAGLAATPLA